MMPKNNKPQDRNRKKNNKPQDRNRKKNKPTTPRAGQIAQAGPQTLTTMTVGCLPILNRLLERMRLEQFFYKHLKPDGARTRLSTPRALLVLVRNLLLSREPIYGIGEWAALHAPDLLGLSLDKLAAFNDDRLGRALDKVFASGETQLVMDLIRWVIQEFGLSLDEMHNDSTSVSVFGAYSEAEEEGVVQGQKTVAITYGHSKDHRPDLKQLLYTLTITDDGGVPIYFTTHSGNTVDDKTHCETWDILRQLVGRADFLYVADCKLASTNNMNYIHNQGGRFVTVLPATRKEDRQFRDRLSDPESIPWDLVYHVFDEEGEIQDTFTVCTEEMLTKEKYRLWWFHSTRKARRDESARLSRIERAINELADLNQRLRGPRPRLRTVEQVQPVVDEILKRFGVEELVRVTVRQYDNPLYKQASSGRPNKQTKYVKQSRYYCQLEWELDPLGLTQAQRADGVFPLITNAGHMTAEDVLRAYKRQPIIEKRFSQLKTDFAVAPIYLKSVSRIQALFCVYFFSLMLQTLLERELRQAMEREGISSLPLYPEGRPCAKPTTRRIIDVFEPVQRHLLQTGDQTQTFTTELTTLQKLILKLLGLSREDYAK
jgi:transposase